MEINKVALNVMEAGRSGVVIEIQGGQEMTSKLSTLGIRLGEKIKKISQQAMHGPVLIEVGRAQVAIGYGMAGRVIIEVEE